MAESHAQFNPMAAPRELAAIKVKPSPCKGNLIRQFSNPETTFRGLPPMARDNYRDRGL